MPNSPPPKAPGYLHGDKRKGPGDHTKRPSRFMREVLSLFKKKEPARSRT